MGLVVEALLNLSFHPRDDQILLDMREYDRRIVLPIPSHSAGPA
jgi:hypothetical protein